MTALALRWQDVTALRRFDNMLGALGKEAPKVLSRAVNRAGDMARTQVRRELTAQTGLKRKTIVKAVKTKRAGWRDLSYEMRSRGGDIALKFFAARETRKGVSAAPFGKRRVFAGMFIKGGRVPGRVPLNMGGHVFRRVGQGRVPIELQDSGVIIPAEMVEGATAQAFRTTASRELPRRVEHEIGRLLR